MKILLLEGDGVTRSGILEFLHTGGHQVTVPASGTELLSVLAESYDLIVTDGRTSGLDGATLLAKLHEAGRKASVLLMVAHAAQEDAVKALKAGADDYLLKPVNLDELGLRIERIGSRQAIVHENLKLRDQLQRIRERRMQSRAADLDQLDYQSALRAAVAEFEREYLRRRLAANQGNISKTAFAIGLSRVALHKKIKRHNIEFK